MPVSSRVARSESLRSEVSDQSKRVSFHRSVDIKRIPKIAEQPKPPVINDKEILLREARDVVKSIDSVQCSVNNEILGKTNSRSNSATLRRENYTRGGSVSRGNSVDRVISVAPAPSKVHSNSNGFHTFNKVVGSRSSVRDSSSRDNSVTREIHSRANSVSRTNPPPPSQSTTTKTNQSNSINKTPEKTVINRVSGTLKRVKSAVNKKKVPPPPKQTQVQKTQKTIFTPPPPPLPPTTKKVVPVVTKREKSPEMTRNPRVSSIVDKLSNMKTSPPPFQYDSQPFSYISGRPKLSSPKEVIYAQVVVGDKDKRTVHRSVRGGGYSRTLGYTDLEEEDYSNKINGEYHHDYGSNKNGGYSTGDLISNNDSDYLDEYLKTAKPRANVTTVLLNNVDDEDFTVEKSHFRFRSVSPKNYNMEDYSFKDNGFSYGSLGRYNNNSTTSSSRYRNGTGNGTHREKETTETTFNGRDYDEDFAYKKYDDSTGYYNHETKDTTMYFGDYYDYKENKKDTYDSPHDDDYKLDAKIDKWRDHRDITYEDGPELEYKDKYDDYYPTEDKYLKKYDHYESQTKEEIHQKQEAKKSGKTEKEITSTRLVKEIEKTRENSLPSAKMVNNVKKESKGGIFSTLTRKEKFPFFTFNKKKNLDKEIEEVERRRDGEYHQNWSSADDLYRDDVVKTSTDTSSADYRRNLAMRSSTMTRPVKIQEEELRSKSLDRRFKTPKIVITPNTPAVEDNKPPVFRNRENNLRYFGDTDCEDAKIAPPTQWPPPNNSSESENGSRMSGSQRSVYLHAAAVADIPPTGLQRRTMSRDELSNHSGHQKQTRHLARSMSVLAPWRPRHYREKYEVHYSNGGRPPKPPRSPTRKSSPHRATSSDSLLKIDEEKEIGKNSSKNSGSVSRSKSMPKDSRLASWLRRKYKR